MKRRWMTNFPAPNTLGTLVLWLGFGVKALRSRAYGFGLRVCGLGL